MPPRVARPHPQDKFSTPEGCFILESWNDASDGAASIARARVEPGRTTRRHRLRGVVERYVIVQGSGIVRLGASQELVVPGDVVIIPAGESQQITNTGDCDLVFYCVCTPRFAPDCYESLE